MADGYISDVPSRVSNSPSDISNDLVQSTQALEKNFKDRYKVLKATYESRLKQLSGVIADACTHIVEDEIVKEMKSDSTSVAFLPAHICEIVETYLHSERETLVRQLIMKSTALEGDLKKSKSANSELMEKLNQMEVEISKGRRAELQLTALQSRTSNIEREFEAFSRQADADMAKIEFEKSALQSELDEAVRSLESVMERLTTKSLEYEELKASHENRTKDLKTLEESFEQSARELAIMEEVEMRDRMQYDNMKSRYESTAKELSEMTMLCNDLKLKLQASQDEISRNKIIFDKLAQEEDSIKGHVSQLMSTVEKLLADEAKESNETLLMMHRKMKATKERYAIELNKEKRLFKGVQDEVIALRSTRDDQHRQITSFHEQCTELRDKLNREHENYNNSQLQLQDSNRQISDLRVKIKDLELNERVLTEKLRDFEKIKDAELKLHGEKVKIEVEKNLENEKFHLEKKTQAYRMHYENELSLVQQNVRNSFNASQQMQLQMQQQRNDPVEVAMSIEAAIRTAKESWIAEKARLENEHAARLSRVQGDAGRLYVQRLKEADDNIERLKSIVKEKQSMINKQAETIESLRRESNTSSTSFERAVSASSSPNRQNTQSKAHRYGNSVGNVASSIDWDEVEDRGALRQSSVPIRDNSNANMRSSGNNNINSNSNNNINSNSNNNNRSSEMSSSSSKIDASSLSKIIQENGILREQQRAFEEKIQSLDDENQKLIEELDICRDQAMKDSDALETLHEKCQKLHEKCQALVVSHERGKLLNLSVSNASQLDGSLKQVASKSSNQVRDGGDNSNSGTRSERNLLNITLDLNDSLENGEDEEDESSVDNEEILENDYIEVDDDRNDVTGSRSHPGSNKKAESSMQRLELSRSTREDLAMITELEDRIFRHEDTIKKLENQLIAQKEHLLTAKGETEIEKDRVAAVTKQLNVMTEVLYKVDSTYRTQLTQMKILLTKLRGEVSQVNPTVQLETEKTMRSVRSIIDTTFAKISSTIENRLAKASRVELSTAHNYEMKLLEENYIKKYQELSQQYKEELANSKNDIMMKTESVLSSHKSLDNVPSYESVCNGLLEGLMQQGVILVDQYSYVIDLAKKHSEPSYSASSLSKSLISDCVHKLHEKHREEMQTFEKEYNLIKEENSSLQEQFSNKISSQHNIIFDRDRDNDDSYSSISGSDSQFKGGEFLRVSQQQQRDGMLLAELSKIESESKAKALQDEIDEIKSLHAIELERMKASRGDIEAKLRRTMEEEIVSIRAREKAKQVSIETELREERNRRLMLQASLAEVESDFESTVENLENENKALLAKLSSLGN